MLTRRNYITISCIMLVIFFLFQAINVVKEMLNPYGENRYAESLNYSSDKSGAWNENEDMEEKANPDIIYIGDIEDAQTGNVVSAWCDYRKYVFCSYDAPAEVSLDKTDNLKAVLVDSNYVDFDSDTELFDEWTEKGIPIVFCNLPEAEVIAGNKELMQLLGISEVRSNNVTLDGIDLFGGFLLGGRTIYEGTDDEDERQDMDLDTPWYVAGTGTKVYMRGRMENEENEKKPAIIWRHSINDAMVCAISGKWLCDMSGLGILDGMMYEINDYYIYPVVNAQNMVISNFAGCSSEQDAELQGLYGHTQEDLFQNVVWPTIDTVCLETDNKPTVMFCMKTDYTDERETDEDRLIYYMKIIREEDGEAGLSLYSNSDTGPDEKLDYDKKVCGEALPDYSFRALYVDINDENEYGLSGLSTYTEAGGTLELDMNNTEKPVGYAGDNTTFQRGTHDAYEYTFSDDLRLKSMETSLGYSNIMADMNRVLYPEKGAAEWETLSEKMSSNTATWWKPYSGFDKTTLSESDERIRQFLNLDYEESRDDNKIKIELEGSESQAYFILRTHNESVKSVRGGSFRELEDNAYLIEATGDTVTITLQNDEKKYSGTATDN